METDPRNDLFKKVLELVDDSDLEYFNLGMFSKEKASEILSALNKSKDPGSDLIRLTMVEEECIEKIDENKPFSVSDLTTSSYNLSDVPENANNTVKCIAYLHSLIEKFRNGEAISVTSATLLKDGKSSIWVPNGFSHDKVDKLFDPVIKELVNSEPYFQFN